METQSQIVGMPITFNGTNLNQWFIATDVQRGVGTNHSNQLTKVGKSDGQYFQYMTRDVLTIQIVGYVRDDDDNTGVAAARRSLAQALDTDELAELIFGDEPDKYYNAIVDGQSSMTETGFNGTLTISFIVPDGVAHAVTPRTFSKLDSDGNISVRNSGSYQAYPILEATMSGDNGLVAFANDNGGVLQFGNPGEVDGVQHDDSQTSYHFSFLTAPTGVTLNNTVIRYPSYPYGKTPGPNQQIGTFDYNVKNVDAATPVYDRKASDRWAGPSLSGKIGPNSLGVNTGNFIFANRFNIKTGLKQIGRMEFNLTSDNSLALSFVLRDSAGNADSLILEFWINNKNYYVTDLNRRTFTDGFYEARVTKLGDNVTFRLAQITKLTTNVNLNLNAGATITKVYSVAGLSNMKVNGYNAWFAGFSNTPGWLINWSDSYFEWVNVDFWQDLPNRFSDGDVVDVDVGNRKVYVNGVEDMTLQTIGNQWDKFAIQPGTTKIQPVCSTWANPFTTNIILREAFV